MITDIHSHVLPGVDDGSPTIEMSMQMIRKAVAAGCHNLVCTPHANHPKRSRNLSKDELQRAFADLCEVAASENLPIELSLGMEIFMTEDCLSNFTDKFLALNASRYYLIEFPFEVSKWQILESVLALREKHIVPIVAHPERYYSVQAEPSIIYKIYQMGALAQLNAGSVIGYFGREAADAARCLLNYGLITAIASDAHDDRYRTCDMQKCEYFISRNYGSKIMRKLMIDNPRNIVRDETVIFGDYQPLAPRI